MMSYFWVPMSQLITVWHFYLIKRVDEKRKNNLKQTRLFEILKCQKKKRT